MIEVSIDKIQINDYFNQRIDIIDYINYSGFFKWLEQECFVSETIDRLLHTNYTTIKLVKKYKLLEFEE